MDFVFTLLRPLRAVVKRWAPSRMRQAAWNAEFRRGRHLHRDWSGERSSFCDLVERYARRGDILDLGCADGHVGLGLRPDGYSRYTGVDISDVAVRAAYDLLRSAAPDREGKNRFVACDVGTYAPDASLDAIVFKDSLYYFPRPQLEGVLRHYQAFLKPGGVFVVQMDDIGRHGWIRDLIRERFEVVEDHESRERDFMALVFR
jgi:SAM-dependent methyltransferase